MSKRKNIPGWLRQEMEKTKPQGCEICRSKDLLELDHVIPLSRGGTTNQWNLRWLCRYHNRSLGSKGILGAGKHPRGPDLVPLAQAIQEAVGGVANG